MVAPLIVVVGETAMGKTALSLELAAKFNGEIINADSWTVRREVNIGTAKPTETERSQVPHHLIDIVEPCDDFTAAVFKKLANACIEDISARGKLPIMVGGTGLYIDSILFDYSFLPPGDRQIRQQLNILNIEELVALAQKKGLDLSGIDARNKRRLIRLIETEGTIPKRKNLRPNTFIAGVKVVDKETLKVNIARRVEAMLQGGLEQEVRDLVERYGWGCEALKGIGYTEWREYFEGSASLNEVREKITRNTEQLAKRQRTWFKRHQSIQWYTDPNKIVEDITTFLNKRQ